MLKIPLSRQTLKRSRKASCKDPQSPRYYSSLLRSLQIFFIKSVDKSSKMYLN